MSIFLKSGRALYTPCTHCCCHHILDWNRAISRSWLNDTCMLHTYKLSTWMCTIQFYYEKAKFWLQCILRSYTAAWEPDAKICTAKITCNCHCQHVYVRKNNLGSVFHTSRKHCNCSKYQIDSCCFYYFIKNSLVHFCWKLYSLGICTCQCQKNSVYLFGKLVLTKKVLTNKVLWYCQRANVVYWKTKRKIKDDLQCN